MRVSEWFYSLPLLNVDWSSVEVGAVLRSVAAFRWLGTGTVRCLEEEVRKITGAREVVAFERGRSALRWILEWSKVLPEGGGRRQVIIPALVCKAVLDAVRAAGLEPVLCDVTEDLAMDPATAETVFDPGTTLAVVVPHIYGWPSPVHRFRLLSRGNGAVVIDDAAAALGGRHGGIPLGLQGDAGLYSFSQGKAAVAGGGGMLVLPEGGAFSRDAAVRPPLLPPSKAFACAAFLRFLWQDLLHRYSGPLQRIGAIAKARLGSGGGKGVPRAGIEHRGMAGLPAAPALAQVRRLEALAGRRRRNMIDLREELSDLEGVRVLPLPEETTPTRFALETLELSVERDDRGIRRENPLAVHLRKLGIEARYGYLPLSRYVTCAGLAASELAVSERLGDRMLLLPFFGPLGRGEMARIGRAVRAFFGK